MKGFEATKGTYLDEMSDLYPFRTFDNPGFEELVHSLNGFTQDVLDVDNSYLKFLRPMGKAPSTWKSNDRKAALSSIKSAVIEAEASVPKDELKGTKKLEEEIAKTELEKEMEDVGEPMFWFAHQMGKLKIRQEFGEELLGSIKVMMEDPKTSVADMWNHVIQLSNGFVKQIVELKNYCRKSMIKGVFIVDDSGGERMVNLSVLHKLQDE